MTQAKSLKVFFSYSHEDELLRHKLEKHFSSLKNSGDISEWFDGKITGGSEIEQNIDENLNASDIILLLISSSYLDSYYCYEKEMKMALQMHAEGKTRVIPIILRPCDWQREPFGGLKALPKDGLAVTEWPNEDSALSDIAKGLRAVVEEIKNSRTELSTSNSDEPKKTRISITLPTPTVSFVTRHDQHGENLIEKISKSLAESDNNLVVLWGSGGNGKTTLAAQFARASVAEKQIVWVDADGRTDISAGVLLDEIVTQLGQPEARQLPPTLKHEQALALLTEKPSLVILDNFETLKEEYQKECLELLKIRDFAALITTREKIAGVRNENVFEMSESEANAFLERLIEDSTFPQAFSDEIRLKTMKIAERNPLVMQWVVGQIGAAQSPKEVFDDLEHGEGDAAERVFDRSFNLPQLGNDGRNILLALSLFVLNARRRSVKDLMAFGQDAKRFNKALKSLANLRLVNVTEGSERLFLGGLTRQFARAYLDKSSVAKLFRQKFVAYFANFAKVHSKPTSDNLNQLEADKTNLFSAIDLAFEMESRNLFILGGSLPEFINIRGHWEDGILISERILRLAVKLDNEKEIAFFSSMLGVFYQKRGDLDKAKDFYDSSLEIEKKLGDQSGIAVCLHNLGNLASNRGDLEEAERLYRESLEIEKKLGNPSGIAVSLHNLGNLASNRGDLEEAERLYRESLEIKKKLGDQSEIASCMHSLGNVATSRGELEEAEQFYRESLEIKKKLGDQSGIAGCLHSLGNLASNRGELEEAEQFYRESLEMKKKLGDQSGIAGLLHSLGIQASDRGELEEAEQFYRESLEIKKKLGDQSGIAGSLHGLGILASIRGELEEAEQLYRESLEIKKKLGDQSGIAHLSHSLGILANNRGELKEAEQLYREGLEIQKKLGDQSGIAHLSHSLGILANNRGELKEAEQLYREGLEIQKKLGDPSGIASSLHSLGILAIDNGKLEEAEQLYHESLEIEKKLGDKIRIATTMNSLGELYFLKRDIASSTKYCRESLEICENLRDIEGINENKRLIGQIHQAGGNFDEAEKFYEESLREFRRLGYKKQIALTLKEYASLAETKEEIPYAIELLTEAREIFEKLGSPKVKEVHESLERIKISQ